MNLPRYEFSKEAESDLVQFLKIANKQKCEENCNLKLHEVWSKLLPLNETLIKKIKAEEIDDVPIVDLCSDDEQRVVTFEVVENDEEKENRIDKSTINDIAFVIKENLESHNDLSNDSKGYIQNCVGAALEMLFEVLENTLSSDEVYDLGVALQDILSNTVIPTFCHNLLIPLIKKEYYDKVSKLLCHFSIKYPSILEEECQLVLWKLSNEEISTFLEYMKKLDSKFQSILVRNFILSLESLDDNRLKIIEVLLNNEVEYEAMNKLVELLSNIAEDYCKDKNFGKLLMNVIEFLGPNLVHVEQPLKHIVTGHKSVWKSKLEKAFTTCYEDSLMFSQSFR